MRFVRDMSLAIPGMSSIHIPKVFPSWRTGCGFNYMVYGMTHRGGRIGRRSTSRATAIIVAQPEDVELPSSSTRLPLHKGHSCCSSAWPKWLLLVLMVYSSGTGAAQTSRAPHPSLPGSRIRRHRAV